MKKYIVPAAVCAAIGALILIFVKMSEPERIDSREAEQKETVRPPGGVKKPDLEPIVTRTKLSEHKFLREFERALGRKDLKRAHWYRQKVCEDLDFILGSEKLTRNLIELIAENSADVNDLRRRDVVLPVLRVLRHPDATKLIEAEFYRSSSENERIMLLEAMSHEYHDPKIASVWAVERALNATSAEHRERAIQVMEYFVSDADLVVDTALQVYASTTRPEQRMRMVLAIADRGNQSEGARKFVRSRIDNPEDMAEFQTVVAAMETWASERDAAELEVLAEQMPSVGDFLRERATMIRRRLRETRNPDDPGVAAEEARERERIEAEAERRRKEEAEKATGDG